ncbi:hypothetical protein OUZ56_022302 [Daphnia magna]|uniref:Uncharacterized protein n=1 Tax=Daphnia magna TaxID=35525 RepID=A0ABR0AVZ2_9CRUS|nr:hypothetical protein OUZ56_022302 [Daphnia magna]
MSNFPCSLKLINHILRRIANSISSGYHSQSLTRFDHEKGMQKQNHNDIYGLTRTIITGPPVPAMLRRDQARAETGESTIRKQMDKTKFYYSLDVKRIIGWARSSMPGATDIELSLMLSLWIWGFSVLNFISVLVLCFWRNMALA